MNKNLVLKLAKPYIEGETINASSTLSFIEYLVKEDVSIQITQHNNTYCVDMQQYIADLNDEEFWGETNFSSVWNSDLMLAIFEAGIKILGDTGD